MNRADVSKLLHLIRALSPAFTITPSANGAPGTGDVWAEMLADIPAADAAKAVTAHYAVTGPWIGVHDIRRRVLEARGLLPPDVETAYAQARRMNAWLDCRVGPEPDTHPAVYTAMSRHTNGIGWEVLDGPEGYARKRFAEAYGLVAAREAERALTTPLPRLAAEVGAPKALPGGSGVEAARKAAEAAELAEIAGEGSSRKSAELRQKTSGGMTRLGDALAGFGNDARFLIPPGVRLDSEFGQAALRHKMDDLGARTDPDEAARKARLEIERHAGSDRAASIEVARQAAYRALEAMGVTGDGEATA